MVLLLLTFCSLLLPLWESVIVLCFVVRCFVSFLVLQSSWWGRESWLLCLICLPGVSWWLGGSSSRCHGVVSSLWLWYFLIILTYYFGLVLQSALLVPISYSCDLIFQRQLHCLGSCPEAPFVFAMGGEKQLKVWDIRDSSTGIVDNIKSSFEQKNVNIFLSVNFNICFGCSKEPSHWDGYFEYPQHMFWLWNKKTNLQSPTLI